MQPTDYFGRKPSDRPQPKIYGMRKFIQTHFVVNSRAGQSCTDHNFRQSPNIFVTHFRFPVGLKNHYETWCGSLRQSHRTIIIDRYFSKLLWCVISRRLQDIPRHHYIKAPQEDHRLQRLNLPREDFALRKSSFLFGLCSFWRWDRIPSTAPHFDANDFPLENSIFSRS